MSFSDDLVTTIADCALKSSLVLALAWIVARTTEFRRARAVSRQWWWTAAIMITLALPVTTTLLPRWDCPYWPALGSESAARADGQSIPPPTPATFLNTTGTLVSSGVRGSAAKAGAHIHGSNSPTWRSPLTLQVVFAVVWLVGLSAVIGRWFVGWTRIEVLVRRFGRSVNPRWASICKGSCAEIGLRKVPQLKMASFAGSPMTWGIVRPKILLPDSAIDWSEERLRMVLLHEFNHIKRHDWFFQMLTRVACGVYWFNPLSWLAASSLALERELACDEGAVARESTPSRYAQHLVDIARSIRNEQVRLQPVLSFGAHAALETRVRNVLSVGRKRMGFACLPVVAVLASLALTLATAAPVRQFDRKQHANAELDPSFDAVGMTLQGAEWMRAGDFDRAIDVLQSVVDSDQWQGEAWFRLGFLLHKKGRLEEALAASRRAIAISPKWRMHALYNEACTLAVLGRTVEALAALRAAWDAGYRNVITILEDPDLASLRTDAGYYAFLDLKVMQ